jgi:ankyrin repeat protein
LFHLAALKKINPLFGNFSRNLDIDLFNSQDINSNIKRCIVFSNDNLDYAKCLVDNKSDMNVQDIVGRTPLHYASLKIIFILLNILFIIKLN